MASDPTAGRPAGDPDLERFQAGSDFARSLLPSISREGAPYADVFTQQISRRNFEGSVRTKSDRMLPISLRSASLLTEGLGLRRLGKTTAFAALNGFDGDAVEAAAKRVAAAPDLYETVTPDHTPSEIQGDLANDFYGFIRETLDSALSLLDDCLQLTVRVSTFEKRTTLANTLGCEERSTRRRTELHVEAKTNAGNLRQTWVEWDFLGLPSANPGEIAIELLQRAERLSEATGRLPESAPVLLPPGWGGTWMHEAVGHTLEADTALNGHSMLHDLRGSRVANADLTVIDDGTLRPSRVEAAFDDEGVPTQASMLIEAGIVVGLLSDRITASQFGLSLTGNGRRPHFGVPPRPRMTNLVLQPGTSSREDMISRFEALIVVERIGHAWLNPEDGTLSLQVEDASLVQRGETVCPLRPFVATSDPIQLLTDVIAIGDDFAIDLDRGYCMKGGSALPVTIGQPSVLIRTMQLRSAPPA